MVPGFESLINQEQPIRILTTLLRNGTLPHALLFTGTEGVGKEATAVALAMACNCQRELPEFKADHRSDQDPVNSSGEFNSITMGACGVCRSCRKIAAGNHPDIIHIKPIGPFIKIDQIRSLLQTLAMKPYEAITRVAVLSEAQAMNAAASNALLKILEEPPSRSMLVLTANQKSDLLPTIVSRCQNVGFNPIPSKKIASWLKNNHGIEPEAADILAAMANGSFSRARMMIDENWLQRRKWVITEMDRLSLQPIAHLFAVAEKLSREKERLAQSLEIIKVWFRDLIIHQYDSGKIINRDVADKIGTASQKNNLPDLLSKVDAVQETQNRLAANTNLRLAMEDLLITLANLQGPNK
ncbi:MAG: DNA polymerase III subunit delta' [Desulfobacterales bacterium]|jgi:DNA polymerase-3 subunit delta'